MARMKTVIRLVIGRSSLFVSSLLILFAAFGIIILVVDGFSPSSSSSSTYSYSSSKQKKYHLHHTNKQDYLIQQHHDDDDDDDDDDGIATTSSDTTTSTTIINKNNNNINNNNKSNNNKSIRRQIQRSYKLREFCSICKRPIQQCVCNALPSTKPLNLQNNKILIIQHPKEFKKRKTISTVPLIELVLGSHSSRGERQVEICVGTSLDVAYNIIDTAIIEFKQKPLLLFPGPNSIPLNEISLQDKGRNEPSSATSSNNSSSSSSYILILVDGTWGQARRMIRDTSIELLEKCCMVQFSSSSSLNENENEEEADNDSSIDDGNPSNNNIINKSTYGKIRQQPYDYCLSTLEACAKALPYLLKEGKDHGQHLMPSQYLLQTLELFVNIQIGHEIKQQQQRIIDEQTNRNNPAVLSSQYHLRLLSKDDAEFVNNNWEYQSGKKSLKMIRNYIGNNTNACCLGIEYENNQTSPELVGCIIRYPYTGALGMLYVNPNHRQKGLASILLQTAIQIIIIVSSKQQQQQQYNFNKKKNDDNNADDDNPNQTTTTQNCFCYILDGNIASESLFKKHGFILEEEEMETSNSSRDGISGISGSGKTNNKKKRGTGRRRSKRKWILPS